MDKHTFISFRRLFLITLLGFTVFSCSEQNNELSQGNGGNVTQKSEDGSDSYPITIGHAFGETQISAKPERIATVAWSNQDIPLALGVVPVGFSEANYGVTDDSGLLPWISQSLRQLGIDNPNIYRDSTGFDYEAISDSQPDVILAAYSGLTREEYDILSRIAPVVAYPNEPWQTKWREQTLINSRGMGMESEGIELVSSLETMIHEKTSIYPEIKGKTVGFFYFIPTDFSQYYVYLPQDPRAAFLIDLGLVHAPSVLDFDQEFGGFAALISSEYVDRLSDLDIIVAYGNDELLRNLQNDSLLGTIPAIQRGSVVFLENDTPLAAAVNPSALSMPAIIDQYLQLISQAAMKVDK